MHKLSRQEISPAARTIAAALFVTAVVGCRGTATPTPKPTAPPATLAPLPSDTPTLTVTPTYTPSVTPIPTATTTAVFVPLPVTDPERECEIPLGAEAWWLSAAPDSPPGRFEAWAVDQTLAFGAEVVLHLEDSRAYLLSPGEEGPGVDLLLKYGREPLPIEPGRRYSFKMHNELYEGPPLGRALRIDDEEGLLYLGISARETEGAAELLLGGDRAGFEIRQLPTRCQYAPIDECGYELRAAPVEFKRGDDAVKVIADSAELVGRDPPYLAIVYTSHYRLWVRDEPCEDPAAWPLSYALIRQ